GQGREEQGVLGAGQALLDVVGGGQDLADAGDHVQGQVDQVGPDLVAQGGEGGLVPGRAAGVGHELVDGGGGAVLEEVDGVAVRVAAQGQLVGVGQAALHEPGRGREG